jgi:hypothetical protein
MWIAVQSHCGEDKNSNSLRKWCAMRFQISHPIESVPTYYHQKMGPDRDFYEGQRTKQTERQPIIMVYFMKLNT